MCEFSLSSEFFTNILAVANSTAAYRDRRFSIVINESVNIDLPQIVAASLSKTVTHMLETDQTSTELHVRINSSQSIKSSLDKIYRCIVSNEGVKIDEDDAIIFAEFGACIGNNCFSIPLKEHLDKESSSINEECVIRYLKLKQKFSITDRSNEILFIAENFETMRTNKEFICYSSDYNNIEIIENILNSEELKLLTEDSLVSFIIEVCRNNKGNDSFLHLFDKVLFEYCSSKCCEEFLHFVSENVESPKVQFLILCMKRRFIQEKLPLDPPFISKRHKEPLNEKPHIDITNEESLNGILRREYQKENLLLEASTTNTFNSVNNLVKQNEQSFQSQDLPNSFFQASLKNGKTFVVKKYSLSGYRGGYDVQHWRLDGQRSSDGEWIMLDRQRGHPISGNTIQTFSVSCKERLKAIKFTQEGVTTFNNNYLTLSGFDIFGSLYDE